MSAYSTDLETSFSGFVFADHFSGPGRAIGRVSQHVGLCDRVVLADCRQHSSFLRTTNLTIFRFLEHHNICKRSLHSVDNDDICRANYVPQTYRALYDLIIRLLLTNLSRISKSSCCYMQFGGNERSESDRISSSDRSGRRISRRRPAYINK